MKVYNSVDNNISNHIYKVNDIEWDVDNEEELEDLPVSVVIPNGELDSTIEIYDAIGDWLSNTYGYCHNGFTFE